MTTAMRNVWVLPLLVVSLGGVGCLDLLGFKDPVLDECAPAGCTGGGGAGGGTTTGGGTGGVTTTTGSGGEGGTGGGKLACEAAGSIFDVFAPASLPDVKFNSLLVVGEPGVFPPRAHVFRQFTDANPVLRARTIRGPNQLGGTASVEWPGGNIQFATGYAQDDSVTVVGQFPGAAGQTVGQVTFAKTSDDAITDQGPVSQPFADPADCTAADRKPERVFGSWDGEQVRYFATWDGCEPGARRLYRGTPQAAELLRTGEPGAAVMSFTNYSRAAGRDLLIFSDQNETYYSIGETIEALKQPAPLLLGDPATHSTVVAALGVLPSQELALYPVVLTKGSFVPATLHGAVLDPLAIPDLSQKSSYQDLTTFTTISELTQWTGASSSNSMIVVGGISADGSAARFSVFGMDGAPMILNQDAAAGAPGDFRTASAVPFGTDSVLVVWLLAQGTTYTVQSRVFTCK